MTQRLTTLTTTIAIVAYILFPLLAAGAQQKAPLIGFLTAGTESELAGRYAAFRDKMRELGYIEGDTIRYAYRYAEGRRKQLTRLAAELVRLKPDVIVTHATPPTRAAQKATRTIPIVMSGGDPVLTGLVKSLARPGGNITGQTVFPGPEFYVKRLAILKEAAPATKLVGVLFVPTTTFHQRSLKVLQASAPKIGVQILPLPVSKPEDVEGALDVIMRKRAGAFFAMGSPLFGMRRKQITTFARENRLANICSRAIHARQGCLIAYGVDFHEMFRRKALQADRILKGANPAEMPVQQPTKFTLTVNRKTAKAIGIELPRSLLLRADEVIE